MTAAISLAPEDLFRGLTDLFQAADVHAADRLVGPDPGVARLLLRLLRPWSGGGQGLGGWSGWLWGFVQASRVEVVFMWFMEPWRRRVGPELMLVLGGAGAMIRWTALAFSPPLWLLFPIQALHALSYTATFLASLRLIERLSPPESASAGADAQRFGFQRPADGPGDHRLGAAVRRLRGAGLLAAMTAIAGLGLAGRGDVCCAQGGRHGAAELDPSGSAAPGFHQLGHTTGVPELQRARSGAKT